MLSGSTILGGLWVGWVGGWLNTDYKASLSPQLKLGLGLGLSLAIYLTNTNNYREQDILLLQAGMGWIASVQW